MLLRNLFNKCLCGVIGFLDIESKNDDLFTYLNLNEEVYNQFSDLLFAFNYSEYKEDFILKIEESIKKKFPHALFIHSNINRGHNFGTADLDNMVFDYCKIRDIKWLCKTSLDMVFDPKCLDKEIHNSMADLYYLPAFSYETLLADASIMNYAGPSTGKRLPQTNLYIINVKKTDYLNSKGYIDITHKRVQTIKDYNGKVWEYINRWSCEQFLEDCVIRNKLRKECLLDPDEYIRLWNVIIVNKIGDPSHKNIMVGPFIHLHSLRSLILS